MELDPCILLHVTELLCMLQCAYMHMLHVCFTYVRILTCISIYTMYMHIFLSQLLHVIVDMYIYMSMYIHMHMYVCSYMHNAQVHVSVSTNPTHLRKVSMVVNVEYCWLIFSEGVVQGGGFIGTPGGNRPQIWETNSTSSPRYTLMEERCFTPHLGTSGGKIEKTAIAYTEQHLRTCVHNL